MSKQNILNACPHKDVKAVQLTSCGDVRRWSGESWRSLADIRKIVELEKENNKLTERCKPSKVVMIGDAGHYVSEPVFERIAELEKIITQIKEVAEFHPPDRAIINLVKLALKEKGE
jgi:hypothetical protein